MSTAAETAEVWQLSGREWLPVWKEVVSSRLLAARVVLSNLGPLKEAVWAPTCAFSI